MYRQAVAEFSSSSRLRSYDRTSPREDLWILYLPAFVVTACIGWWECLPVYIGYALSVFALVAFIYIARASASSLQEKLVWTAMGLALVAAEIDVAFNTHLRTQSFLVCHFTAPGVATVDLHGRTPLRATFMEIGDEIKVKAFLAAHVEDAGGWFDLHQHVSIGAFAPGCSRSFAVKSPEAHNGTARYQIQFLAGDDAFSEDFQSVMRHQRSVQALRIMRYLKGKPAMIYEEADPDYPRDGAKRVDWAWTVQEP